MGTYVINKKTQIIWLLLWISSVAGIIFMLVNAYTLEKADVYKNGILISRSGPNLWKEHLITPLYFTFMSNVFAFITATIVNVKILLKKDKFSKNILMLKMISAILLLVTFLIYWSILGPSALPRQNIRQISSNVIVHGITPILTLIAFFITIKTNKIIKLNFKKTLIIITLIPILWIIMATILYYSLGGDYPDAIYKFIRFNQNAWWISIIYMSGITFGFLGIISGFIFLNNKYANLNK